ncbi:carbohydrate ABC transporter permease [Cohnella thailandensis]|jgi:ABC-type sugar transport system, permease component|uniref:Carbohydrate ABC transporter permease n=1 Tax=Cohnella thailandensis TaxID=557557 RepID=A0A841SWH8_9BACL|nr:carbohydrate ABC transporter permease [Cohnella thailandensis]MBB6634465.1 carbohydrate ABC transporter permease [Cohnella thailandensis]MBP1972981.1 putative aldouronate transport system permease protein [Cohnella thailandensis]
MKASAGTLAAPRRRRFDSWDVLIHLSLIIASLACLLPFLHVVSKSFSEDAYVIANKVVLWPEGFTIEAYKKIFADASILRSLYVSVVVTVLFTILGMILTIFAAYPLSRKTFKGRTVLTFIFLFTMYFQGGIIPDYMLINNLGMLETMWSLVLPLAFSAFNLLIMKSALSSSIPDSLEESARIDGAGHFRILWSIVLPLSKPILATLALFFAVGRWNAYQDALFYIKQNVDMRPLQLKLYYLVVAASESFQLEATNVQLSNPEVLKASCVVFATVPILLIYPFIQKYFVQGAMLGAVKE